MIERFAPMLLTALTISAAAAPMAEASGWVWAVWLKTTTVGQLANRYAPSAPVLQAAAAVRSQGYGCANIVTPTTGWVWSGMYCTPAPATAFTPTWGGFGYAMAWNDCYCTQQMAAADDYYEYGWPA